jgi:multicomponent Na+:H+ antiporter subunit E
MAKANIDVAYRVITGRINPAILKIDPKLDRDLAVTMLATSITLTPGTLSVDVDEETNELYVHWINIDPEVLKDMPRDYHPICNSFPDWARRIAN